MEQDVPSLLRFHEVKTYEDLARALKRFEELFGAPKGPAGANELGEITEQSQVRRRPGLWPDYSRSLASGAL